MTSVLKILLHKGEEEMACLLTAYYEVALEPEMMIEAIKKDQYSWL